QGINERGKTLRLPHGREYKEAWEICREKEIVKEDESLIIEADFKVTEKGNIPEDKLNLEQFEPFISELGMNNEIRKKAGNIYRQIKQKGLLKGTSRTAMKSASIYASYRSLDEPVTISEINKLSNCSKGKLKNAIKRINEDLDLNIRPPKPEDFVEKISSKISLNRKTKEKALEIIKKARNKNLHQGKSPTGFAAGAIYLAGRITNANKITQLKVAEAANVTEVTVRSRYKDLKNNLNLNVKPKMAL
ncbi:MAG: transcription initiation factor IIB, partial [Promethearchaeia archaeon]